MVTILGTDYEIKSESVYSDPSLIDIDAYCDNTLKKIVISSFKNGSETEYKRLKRHEIIHAFLYESGLDVNSDWGTDETLVDWIALQFPKMVKAFKEADCLGE